MAKYRQYDEYKNTGVSWVPEMPQGWKVTKLKYLIKTLESGVSVNAADYPKSEGEVGVLKTSCVYTREFRAEENKTVFEEELSRVKCPVRAGSIIISRMNTPDLVGAAVYVKHNYSNLYLPDRLWQTVYNNEKNQSSRYLYYFMHLKGFRDQISNFAEGASSSMQSISKEDFLSINTLLPTRDVQEEVANFLDFETAQIDTLIEKQQTLIQLLREKRQAVISHAVTKGLNPDVPMKDSGVEWLGEVPAHWTRKSLNYLIAHTVDNRGRTPPIVEEGIPMVEVSQIAGNGVYTSNNYSKFITQKSYEQFVRSDVQENDILFVTVGATFGKTCLVPPSPDFFIAQNVVGFRCVADVNPKFFMFLFSSSIFKEAVSATNKSSTIDNVKVSDLVKTRVVIPPYEEQEEIANHIFKMVDAYEALVTKAEQAIQLMQERRTALISAAVTGKIDVRGWDK